MTTPFVVRYLSARETHDLRLRVLRPGQPPERADYYEDQAPDAFHLGAFDSDGALAGVASFYREPFPDGPGRTGDWRLRGMAVEPSVQGRGAGRALITAALEALRARGGARLWCNARTTAEPFYTAMGFDISGDPFEMAEIGTHYRMMTDLTPLPPSPDWRGGWCEGA